MCLEDKFANAETLTTVKARTRTYPPGCQDSCERIDLGAV